MMSPAGPEWAAAGTGLQVGAVDLAAIPAPGERRLALRVTPAGRRALRSGHPWLFDEAITGRSHDGKPGDLAVVFDDRRRFLAVGLYDPTSPLRVRVLQHGTPAAIDRTWLRERLVQAAAWRASLPETGTTGYRLVHGENDRLPGLVIDRYAGTLVVKLYTLAWIPWLPTLRLAMADACPAASVVVRLSRELGRHPEYLYGVGDGLVLDGLPPGPAVRFTENGLQFEADVVHGQKTGFYFDQRDNRARVEALSAGRRTLNVFAYSGGFSVYAARGGAPEVVSLDASGPALAAAERNFAINRHIPAVAAARHVVIEADAFDALAGLREQGERYQLVIVDPPAMAKRATEVGPALRAYARLTSGALGVLAPGGMLVIASCSSRVSASAFFDAVRDAAAHAGRPLREFDRTGHAFDHPASFPEAAYLKCLFATA
jgi:23S rRNA (cytosine1962-C5)-methyltransferase